MRKRLILGVGITLVSFGCFAAVPASAHLVGAFQAFLSGVDDKDSEKALIETTEKTKGQQEILKKKTKEKQISFLNEQKSMTKTLIFYDTVAVDSYGSLLFKQNNMVDVLTTQKMMKQKISLDMSKLENLHTEYTELNEALASVKGYTALLKAIKANREKKQYLLDVYGTVTLYNQTQFASVLQTIWNQDMNRIDEYLIKDGQTLATHIPKWLKQNEGRQSNFIGYKQINQKTKLTYLIQKDHIYIVYKHGDGHVILISQLMKQSKSKPLYTLQIEAGFFNGYPLNENIIKNLNEKFIFSYESLQTKQQEEWLFQQVTNGLVVQPVSTIMD